MPNPPPDPNGRPSSVHRAPEASSGNSPEPIPIAPSPTGSTGSHHPSPTSEPSAGSQRASGSSARRGPPIRPDLLQVLAHPGASPIDATGTPAAENSDDAPTIITRNHALAPLPTPLPVSGDVPSIAGRRLGHFELIESIGAGGMAAVLKARDLELGRVVALKILPPEAARDPEGVSRFKQEARAAALLDHENVARVYFCGEDQGLHFIAFEFVDGENLRQLIDQRGTIPPAECVRYMIQIAAGLNHAAERGVVHRDIKPSNIIITPDGRAKIVDMGLARHLDAINGGVTHSGVTLGTFDYISPEQALDPRRADLRSDIYSLGCAFYHALTGRPPVPEGTAAKKLQAHQNVDPLDPRAINPAIPDDLAAILSGMMAKNPEKRYQTPAALIAHLKGLAERLKIPLDVVASDSAVKAVQASQAIASEPPRLRLEWVIAAAAIAIVVAAFALPNGPDSRQKSLWSEVPTKAIDPPIGFNTGIPNAVQTGGNVVAVSTRKELADALADPKTIRVNLAEGTYDLRELAHNVVFNGKELQLVGSAAEKTKIILSAAHPVTGNGPASSGSLEIKADKLTVSRVRFEIHAPLVQGEQFGVEGLPTHPIGLLIQSAGQVRLMDCTFTSKDVAEDEAITVAISAADSKPVQVSVGRCVFGQGKDIARGGVALQVPAHAHVDIDDSGFGPHAAAIQVLAAQDEVMDLPSPTATMKLTRSSFILDPRCLAVSIASATAVTAGHCLFASTSLEPMPQPIVFQTARRDGTSFIGNQRNAYYQVNPLAIGSGDDRKSFSFKDCRGDDLPFTDLNAVFLTQRPWAESRPLDVLANSDAWRAFRLRVESDSALFLPRGSDWRVIGAQFHDPQRDQRRAYVDLQGWPPPPPSTSAAEPRQLVWYPDPKDDQLPGDTYADLATLLRAAHNGDTILIRHSGPLPLEQTSEIKARTGEPEFKLSFKPFPGSKPILTPRADWTKLDQSLFRLLSGEVEFDGLQFLLKPSRPRNRQEVAAVTVIGGKGCTFKNCVFTLQEEDESKASAVLIADPDKFMVMDTKERPAPELKFERCVIRGKGRGIWVPASRAVKVDVSQSLTAIDGPLYLAEAAGKSNTRAQSAFRLTHVTALVGGPLVELKGSEKVNEMGTSGLIPLVAEANSCLFVAVPGAGQPIVEFDGIDLTETMTLLPWNVQTGNRYANFDASAVVMIARPSGEGSMPKEWNWNQWLSFAKEPAGKPLGMVVFEKGPTSLRDLASLKPADTAVKEIDFPDITDPKPKPGDTGVDPKTSLPEPWTDRGPD